MTKKPDFEINFSRPPKVEFLKALTTPTGILQHTQFGVPHRSLGYSVDDNARSLIVAVNCYQLYKKKEYLDLAIKYLSFLVHAKRSDGFFNNFQDFDNKFLPKTSEDSFGEAIWAIGVSVDANVSKGLRLAATNLYSEIKANIPKLLFPRAKAYTLLGLRRLIKAGENNKFEKTMINYLTADLISIYEKNKENNWKWFENIITYANHIIPAALFASYEQSKDKKVLDVATESLNFLEDQSQINDLPSPVGSYGWFLKGGDRALFDQQPVEAGYACLANLEAYRALGEVNYLEAAKKWFSWFYGNNIKKVKVYDQKTGGCFDGITDKGLNLNQGAESIICYLLAYLELVKAHQT